MSVPTLDEAIAQQIALGEKDPLTIARKVERLNGREWLAERLLELGEDIVAERARRRLDANRRAGVLAIRPGAGLKKAELGLETVWVPNALAPGVGARKPLNECTPEDFDAVASYREGIVRKVLAHAAWFREVAARMRTAKAATFREFKGEVPELPESDELEAA